MKAFAEALVAFQSEVENATKNSTNPHYKNRYADLAEVLDTVRPTLAKHGLAVTQTTRLEHGIPVLVTTLWHKSGEHHEGVYPLKPIKDDPQGMGSAMTYARRYCLAAICGISQEDDDGQGASRPPQNHQRQEPPRQAPKHQPPAHDEQGHATSLPPDPERAKAVAETDALANRITGRVYSDETLCFIGEGQYGTKSDKLVNLTLEQCKRALSFHTDRFGDDSADKRLREKNRDIARQLDARIADLEREADAKKKTKPEALAAGAQGKVF